jgi:hypothetical protein
MPRLRNPISSDLVRSEIGRTATPVQVFARSSIGRWGTSRVGLSLRAPQQAQQEGRAEIEQADEESEFDHLVSEVQRSRHSDNQRGSAQNERLWRQRSNLSQIIFAYSRKRCCADFTSSLLVDSSRPRIPLAW